VGLSADDVAAGGAGSNGVGFESDRGVLRAANNILMDTQFTPFMRDLEGRFQKKTGLADRSQNRIFYSQIRPAPILTMGINPGGDPAKTSKDGCTHTDGTVGSKSSSYFEGDEHDVLDCAWKENNGLRKLLVPLVAGERERIRHEVMKSNLAFRRSAKVTGIEREKAYGEAEPFLSEIIAEVKPKLVLLTGPALQVFVDRFASPIQVLAEPEKDTNVRQIIFAAALVKLRATGSEAVAAQVAHASQFGWTYDRYDVSNRIMAMMPDCAF
jgi:hypothetical protein